MRVLSTLTPVASRVVLSASEVDFECIFHLDIGERASVGVLQNDLVTFGAMRQVRLETRMGSGRPRRSR